jgi:hypothetical protein
MQTRNRIQQPIFNPKPRHERDLNLHKDSLLEIDYASLLAKPTHLLIAALLAVVTALFLLMLQHFVAGFLLAVCSYTI